MEDESPKTASAPTEAVFLSYASQDAESAQRICDALRTAGIEVWFDQSELRGGDVWDQKIRHEIHDCALFIPVISTNTASRREGYFRLEWDLADQRSHRIARDQAFIVPVRVDATSSPGTDVPESFHRVQWTHLPSGETPPEFVARIRRLLSSEPPTKPRSPTGGTSGPSPVPLATGRSSPLRPVLPLAVVVLAFAALAYPLVNKLWISKPVAPPAKSIATSSAALPAAFAPPPHSIAVLPFVNLSGDKEQEYFSDGLTEELLNSLADIEGLQVAARTSSFSFREHPDIVTVAHKLNVGAVLEGSVRRSGHTVRVTAQLINAVTGFHLWSKTYDRDLRDVLRLQTEIATAVATALRVTLLGDVGAKIELGGTRNPAAFDAYLRAASAVRHHDAKEAQAAIALYTDAIHLDPKFALAYAGRSIAYTDYAEEWATGAATRSEGFGKAQEDVRIAIGLAPELAEGHMALGVLFEIGSLDFTQANEAYERARRLAPGNAQVLGLSGRFAANMGMFEAGIAANRRAMVLDPLNPRSHHLLGQALYAARRYEETLAAFAEVISLDAGEKPPYGYRGLAYYGLGDVQRARASCETRPDFWLTQWCLAVVYDKLGRHTDGEAQLAKMKATLGDAASYQYATIFAQWGDRVKALECLETALRLRDPGLVSLKTDGLMDSLRKEPRFQAVLRELKFP